MDYEGGDRIQCLVRSIRPEARMPIPSNPKPEPPVTGAADHIASAHQILKALEEKMGEHPEIGAAITKLEMALNDLAIQTGGML